MAANLTVSLGLKDAGYQYINSKNPLSLSVMAADIYQVDDCWSNKSGRDSVTKQIIPNSTTFPGGISGTASKVHSMGLKMGIYSSAGTETCAGYYSVPNPDIACVLILLLQVSCKSWV